MKWTDSASVEWFQAYLRDAGLALCGLPGVGNAGLLPVVPPGHETRFFLKMKQSQIKKPPSEMLEGSGMRPDHTYFRDFTYSATALASSPVTPLTAFLCGAFLASSPLLSRSVI